MIRTGVKNPSQQKILRKRQNRIFLALASVVLLVFSYLSLWADNGLLHLLQLKRIKTAIHEENKTILEQNLSYVQEIKKLKELPYIEQKARSELGYVRPNEVVYVVEEN